jgi:hypothetical protein
MTLKCALCNRERIMKTDSNRIPAGWKRKDAVLSCGDCWRERYILRAVSIPVVSPLDQSWDEFGKALRVQWALVTQASNWMLTEMYAQDNRSRDKGKLQPMPRVYLYPETRRRFPGLPSQTCAALEQAIGKKYRAKRYEVVWTCTASLPTYRYPSPFPVPSQGWSVEMENDSPIVSARIGEQRVRFRLRGGHEFLRQLASVRQIVAGEAEPGQMDLYRKGKSVMCKMVAWLPRTAAERGRTGVLRVHTSPDALLVALNAKDERLWIYHGDQARRWSREHSRRLQRFADDSKAEMRPHPPFGAKREAMARKYRDRMDSLTHLAAAMVAGYAARRHFAKVRYEDRGHEFCPGFPWHVLAGRIAEKCDAARIAFEAASTPVPEETAPSLADV